MNTRKTNGLGVNGLGFYLGGGGSNFASTITNIKFDNIYTTKHSNAKKYKNEACTK